MDNENNVSPEVAPQSNIAPTEQVATTETVAETPVASTDKEELILGKFRSQDDLAKAYRELEAKNTREAQARVNPPIQAPAVNPGYAPTEPIANTVPQLDPESELAVRAVARQEWENARAAEFAHKHATDLTDPVLRGTIIGVIQEENAHGRMISQEDALNRAKTLIDEKTKPQVKQAETQAFEEGQDLARAKEKAGAVGDTSRSNPPVNTEDLSSVEFAKAMNIPRFQG